MTDMTMGQRIAEERRKLALSQEGLGEKVGVSRQAISKWEADGAVPEIDKLIALSKLFDTSVGWLLGVEDAPQEQADALSDEQLYLIEEIVKKYQPKPLNRKALLAGIVFAALMAVSILFIGIRQDNLFARIASGETGLDSLRAQVNNNQAVLESRLDAAQTAQSPAAALLAEYHMEILTSAVDGPAAQIGFSAMPNKWQEGDAGFFSVRREGMETVQVECKWDGAFLTADTILDVENGYEFCFTLLHADGTQEQQVVTGAEVKNLAQTLSVTAEVTPGTAEYADQNLVLSNYVMKVSMPSDAFYGSMLWETVDLILTSSGEELGRFNLLLAEEGKNDDVVRSPEMAMEYLMITFEDIYLPKNEGIQLWIYAETNNGLSTTQLADTWVREADGTLRNQ